MCEKQGKRELERDVLTPSSAATDREREMRESVGRKISSKTRRKLLRVTVTPARERQTADVVQKKVHLVSPAMVSLHFSGFKSLSDELESDSSAWQNAAVKGTRGGRTVRESFWGMTREKSCVCDARDVSLCACASLSAALKPAAETWKRLLSPPASLSRSRLSTLSDSPRDRLLETAVHSIRNNYKRLNIIINYNNNNSQQNKLARVHTSPWRHEPTAHLL